MMKRAQDKAQRKSWAVIAVSAVCHRAPVDGEFRSHDGLGARSSAQRSAASRRSQQEREYGPDSRYHRSASQGMHCSKIVERL